MCSDSIATGETYVKRTGWGGGGGVLVGNFENN